MTLLDKPSPAVTMTAPTNRTSRAGWFRAFWRWHFYASFAVVPILLVLSVTGLIYLLRFQLEPLLNADVMTVEPHADMDFTQLYSLQLAAVERAHPAANLVSLTDPTVHGSSPSIYTPTPPTP